MFNQLGDTTQRAITCGVVGAVGSYLLFGESGLSNIALLDIPTPLVLGVATGVGSWAADALSDTVISWIPQNTNAATIEKGAVKVLLSGGATLGAAKVLTGVPSGNELKAGLLGTGSKVSGDFIFTNYVSPIEKLSGWMR